MAVVTPDTFCLLMAAVYGGFGVTLYANANFFFGPDSIVSYFEESCFQGQFFGRALGLMFTSVVLGPYVFGIEPAALCKQYLMWNSLSMIFFVQGAMRDDTGPGVNALLPINLWITQVAIGLGFLVLNILVVKDLSKGARGVSIPQPLAHSPPCFPRASLANPEVD